MISDSIDTTKINITNICTIYNNNFTSMKVDIDFTKNFIFMFLIIANVRTWNLIGQFSSNEVITRMLSIFICNI